MKLDEIRPRHLRDLVLELRKSSGLAPRTIRHVYAILATMFRTAVADELLLATKHPDRLQYSPWLVSFACALSASIHWARYAVTQLRSRPVTSSNLF